ncbi:MAG: protein phosphatase CheZ [Nitrospira sp.]|nr:protein phosphatase CheZ [Nitrospira sp.]
METDVERRLGTLYGEIGALARFVENAMKTVSEVGRPLVKSGAELPTVTSHLADLSKMTEEGVLEVMRLTELIQDNRIRLVGECRSIVEASREIDGKTLADRIENVIADLNQDEHHLTEIMTALSFQDLVAQRVKKLVTILEDVHEKLMKLVVAFGIQQHRDGCAADGKTEEILRQLEQSRSGGIKQHTADEILARFGFR